MKTRSRLPALSHNQRGVTLIVSLLLLLLMTMVGISLFRGTGLLEKIAGNTREKQRSLQNAQDALLYGEWWLRQAGSATGAQTCTSATPATLQVCSTLLTLSNVSSLPFYSYALPGITVSASGGLGSGGDVNYTKNPAIYIAYMGPSLSNSTPLYQITAIGYGGSGGNNGSNSIVQSVYSVSSNTSTDLSNP